MVSLKQMFQFLGLRPKSPPSRVFVSLNVMNSKHQSGLSRQSTRVILRISIWTCLILVLLFLVVYTILLAYVDKQLHPSLIDAPGVYRRIKLQGRLPISMGYDSMKLHFKNMPTVEEVTHRKVVWNSSVYYHQEETLPQCRWQTVFRILVTSSPEHTDRRNEIRNTWCNPENFDLTQHHAWHCVFLVGMTDNSARNAELHREKMLHNDMLLGNYLDSYRNLTLKVIHGFNWSVNHCPSSYVIKTDDDCFVNAGLMHKFLLYYNDKTIDLYAGSIVSERGKLKVIRGDQKKWSVRYEEYPEEYYPPYASGIGYILSTDVAKRLVAESKYITPISNEDAYVGIVLSQVGVHPVNSNRFVLSSSGLSVCNFLYVFMVHDVHKEQQTEMMRKAVGADKGCNHSAITTWS